MLQDRRQWLKENFPAEYAENEGIAAGAQVNPLLTLFSAYYFGLGFPVNIPNVNIPHCTSFCVPAGSGPAILGSNCDDESLYFFLEYTGSHWYRHVQGIWPGIVGGFGGMNEHGLFIGGTGGSIAHPDDRLGPTHYTPSLMVFNLVLRYCKTIDEAINLISRSDVMGHSNHLLADVSGKAVVVEKALAAALDTYEITKPHALGNFFHSDLREHPSAIHRLFELHPDTHSRYLAMCRELDNRPKPFTVEAAKAIMSSHHKGRPEVKNYASVCNWNTQISYVAVPQHKTLCISGKFPHDNNWLDYKF
jgi:hypothetical protein